MAKLTRRGFIKALSLGAASGAAGACYADGCANWLSVEHHELALPKWDADGFRVGLIADLHMNSLAETERAEKAIRLVMEQKPDVIIVGGDFVNYSEEPMLGYCRRALSLLGDAKCPCLGVLGNHDYDCPKPDLIIDAVRSTPLRLLRNENFEYQGVTIAGLDDGVERLAKYDFFSEGQVSRNCLAILHEPDYVDNMPDNVSAMISGHTHGGQICLPFGVALHTPKGGRRFLSGFYPDAKVPVFVTRGVGTVGVDIRLFCRPEVSVLTLRTG